MNSPLNVLAVQSYGFIENDQDMSSGAVGSRARLLYAAMLVGTGRIKREDLVALFPQGYRPDQIDQRHTRMSLGEMMAKYLRTRPEMDGVKIQHKALGYGTRTDVQNIYEMVRSIGHSSAHISFVTDPVHIRRVQIIWERTHPEGWTAEFFGATFHQMGWKERWIREPAARLQCRLTLRRGKK